MATLKQRIKQAERTTLPYSTDTFLASKVHFRRLTRYGERASARPSSLLPFCPYCSCRVSLNISEDTQTD